MTDFETVSREIHGIIDRRRESYLFLGSVFAALGIFSRNALQGGLPESLGTVQFLTVSLDGRDGTEAWVLIADLVAFVLAIIAAQVALVVAGRSVRRGKASIQVSGSLNDDRDLA